LLLAGDDSPVKFNFLNFDPIPLPLDPEILIRRINPDKIKIFKVRIYIFVLMERINFCVWFLECEITFSIRI